MSSGSRGSRRFRFDFPESPSAAGPKFSPLTSSASMAVRDERLESAVERTRDWLLAAQHADGHWVGELEGDTILESEYILLLAFLGRENTEPARLAAHYHVAKQR